MLKGFGNTSRKTVWQLGCSSLPSCHVSRWTIFALRFSFFVPHSLPGECLFLVSRATAPVVLQQEGCDPKLIEQCRNASEALAVHYQTFRGLLGDFRLRCWSGEPWKACLLLAKNDEAFSGSQQDWSLGADFGACWQMALLLYLWPLKYTRQSQSIAKHRAFVRLWRETLLSVFMLRLAQASLIT